MAWSNIVESIETEEDSSVKSEGEDEAKSLDWEDPEKSSGTDGADQLMSYIVHFANTVKLYQRKNQNCFGCGSPDHLMRDCLKDLKKTTWWVALNAKEGMAKKRGWAPHKPVIAQLASLDEAPKAWRHPKKVPSCIPSQSISRADQRT